MGILDFDAQGYHDIDPVYATMVRKLIVAPQVDTGHWQAVKDVPMTQTRELRNVAFSMPIPLSADEVVDFIHPNMPWAEAHFQERVSGVPSNPGEEYKNWPWYKPEWEAQGGELEGKFSHTYMERMWPQWAEQARAPVRQYPKRGIRYRYGDLNDVVDLLEREPHTRQAYVPIWFPEDTGAHHGERVPCTLGYHLMLRDGKLHCNYFIRSCDIVRYFRDDVYMACRLVKWFIQELYGRECNKPAHGVDDSVWGRVEPGELTMFIHSLHCFEGDLPSLRRKYAPSKA